MSKIWVIADLHLGDERIRRYENRPFENTILMDIAIQRNWNKVVSKEDRVLVLGDVTANKDEKFTMNKFNGHKELVMGNHDRDKSFRWWLAAGFSRVYEYPICMDEIYWLSHEPMYMNINMPYINIHGHTHGQVLVSRTSRGEKQMINVGVDKLNFTPILLEDVKTMFKKET